MAEIDAQSLFDLGVPIHMHDGLLRWVVDGIPPGQFLQAVIKNDLKEACARADLQNQRHIFSFVNWLYNYAPKGCWGGPEQYEYWKERKGLRGCIQGDYQKEIPNENGEYD